MDLSNGAIVNETNLDAFASDLLNLGGTTGHIGARAYNSANVTISNNTTTALTFNSEHYDTDPNGEIHSTSSNTGRLTCRTAGAYYAWGMSQLAANATGRRLLQIRLNGSTIIGLAEIPNAGAAAPTTIQVDTIYQLAANDYLELLIFQDSGGNLDALAQSSYSLQFGMAKI
jgi:hypothetical protein